jgi:hypothetical protein
MLHSTVTHGPSCPKHFIASRLGSTLRACAQRRSKTTLAGCHGPSDTARVPEHSPWRQFLLVCTSRLSKGPIAAAAFADGQTGRAMARKA